MKIFGLPIPFTGERRKAANLSAVRENRGWFRILESFPGAWQTNTVIDRNLVLSYHAVFACMTLIASDISKMSVKLIRETEDDIWVEVTNPAYTPVLRKPNHFQNRIQFWENWILSKLSYGNTYVLKVRDNRKVVVALYILDPCRVTPMVSDDGEVFYKLSSDNIAGVGEDITVPATEIIHDRFNCLFHPLVGLSPIFACGVAATQGLNIQNNSSYFFGNRSMPGGILTAPGSISDETAARLKAHWESNYTGENSGKIAVVGDDLKFQQLAISAADSQMIEQLGMTAEIACSTFHVPPYKIGVGDMPSYNNVQALNVEYYSQCLQSHIEAAELCLDEGLGMADDIGVEFDVDNLLRMDSATQMEVLDKGKNVFTPNESRKRVNLPKKPGGDSVYRQQQDYSLEALAKRDARPDPFASGSQKPAQPALPHPQQTATDDSQKAVNDNFFLEAALEVTKGLS